tara:strand:+ start:489 stop:728 length:240 start_codon:yes stop_codon:yes gene_type:complete
MKYLLSSFMLLGGCVSSIKTMDHPIDPIKQKTLALSESPVLSVNMYSISIMLAVVSLLVVSLWFIAWKKTQNNPEDDSF